MRSILAGLLALGLVSAWAAPARADSVLTDSYWGGDAFGASDADRIGTARFEVSKLTVSASGTNELTVRVYTKFVDGSTGTYSNLGAKLGDLFLSTDGWKGTTTTANYADDYVGSSGHEKYEYVVTLGSAGSTTDSAYNFDYWEGDSTDSALTNIASASGNGKLYAVTSGGTVVTSDTYFSSGYRAHQEVRYLKDGSQSSLDTVEWRVSSDGSGYFIEYIITNSTLATAFSTNQLGVHWAMTCGNDTIAGLVVPEPATIGLMAAGVAMLGARARRKRSAPTA